MKILFHNYTNVLSTEPLYLHHAMSQCGVESLLWSNQKVSTYDMFDSYNPDVFVTHFQTLTYDIMDYLKNNNNCEIVMNVTGATQLQIESIEQSFRETNIKSPFIFTNDFSHHLKTNLNLVTLYPAADIFNISGRSTIDGQMPEAIISNKFDENVENYIGNKEVFHLLYITGNELDNNFDIKVGAQSLPHLYKIYKKCTLIGGNDICCSQIFFDMVLNCEEMQVISSDQVGFSHMLETIFSESESEQVQLEMKKQIKSKHTPFHRAWRFMKYLGDEEVMNKIDQIKNKVPELLEVI